MKRRNVEEKKVDYLLIMFYTPLLQRLYVIFVDKEEDQQTNEKLKVSSVEIIRITTKICAKNPKHQQKNHTF